ncbi:DHH family phosphoesterase [Halobacteriales archaeon QS_9_70_65]|nr:MAG: DHH family phosphoesterase [Halobacteriales archaeon QS_9_70_65]
MDRLVLGAGAVGSSLFGRLRERGDPVVLLENDQQVASLREKGVDARHVDPTEPAAVRTVAGRVDSVVVLPATPGDGRALAETAREAYPEAFVLACLGAGATAADRRVVATYADRVVDTTEETASRVVGLAGGSPAGTRTRRLQRALRSVDGTLGVFTHDDPDPDAIASAVCLRRLAERVGTDAEVCYYGDIDHQENRALVNLLGYDLRNLDSEETAEEFGGVALVDHSRPGINSGLPPETPVDVVVDHHPPRAPVEASFLDLRSGVGSTSTLLAGYLRDLDVEPTTDLATGLLYGLRTDTREFSREVSSVDLEAAAMLVEHADGRTLERIESPSVTGETLDTVATAVRNRRVDGDVVTTCIGEVSDRDALAQAADRLLELEDVLTTLVFGYTDETVFASARSQDGRLDIGAVLRESFGQIGSAGGHADMAGAQIPLGMLVADEEPDPGGVIEDVVVGRFRGALRVTTDRAAGRYGSDPDDDDG